VLPKCIVIYLSGTTAVLVLPKYGGGGGEERFSKAKIQLHLVKVPVLHEHGYPDNGYSAATAEPSPLLCYATSLATLFSLLWLLFGAGIPEAWHSQWQER